MDKNKSRKEFGIIFWTHLGLIVASYLSFLYVDWRVILLGVVVLQIYYALRGGCGLTFAEFGDDRDTTFAWYYLRKVFPRLDQKITKIFIRYVLPITLVLVAYYLQEIRMWEPIVEIGEGIFNF